MSKIILTNKPRKKPNKKRIIAITALIVVLSVVGVGYAIKQFIDYRHDKEIAKITDPQIQENQTKLTAQNYKEAFDVLVGSVVDLSQDTKQIKVVSKTDSSEITFAYDENTSFSEELSMKPLDRGEIKSGDEVSVTYEKKNMKAVDIWRP